MLSSTILRNVLAVLATTSSVTAQALSLSTSFVLWPIITGGTLEGAPMTNWDIDRRQPLAAASGSQIGTSTSDCVNRFIFTSYVGTHCYGSDQCGYKRWSINATNPDPDCNTLVALNGNLASMLISGPNDVDELGRRHVGWSNGCESDTGTPGFSIDNSGEKGIFHVRYDNPADPYDEFGTFFTCWTDGEFYGPNLYYRNSEATTPNGCAELMLVPRCTNDTYVSAPLVSQCYLGGLPA
ncbi:hypothetical protein CBER1_03103 [Cercospora berteroae]|uniref:DUF7907 domain-containing protein n=1 Tax=Cercospora berteroae TaxID=357750 RepID=A0A2S6CK42_9PEZI|nr:hypothetical protein CBER1_03103 [Cercospora berteroae]